MQRIKSAIINFPGTNCENETFEALQFMGFNPKIISHKEKNLEDYNLIVLPGGFSFGDYISCGRIAKYSPVISSIKEKIAKKSAFILGICNGFQILTEAQILPGALIENINGRFISKDVKISFQNNIFTLPIAHHQGRYYINDISKLSNFDIIKYENNVNGSIHNIAGIYDKKNLILGLMPHPERNLITPFKSKNGRIIFDFIKKEIEKEIYGII